MNKEMISGKQAISIITLFLLGSTLAVGTSTEAKQDSWISILLALLMFIPIIMTYIRIVSLFPEKSLYDIVSEIFGNVIGKIIVLLYVLYAIHLGALVIRNFSEFTSIVAMPVTPKMVIQVFLLALCAWMVKSGVEALGRWSKFILPIVILTIFATFIISLKDMSFKNLKPVGCAGFENIVAGAFSSFSFPFAESVLFLPLFGSVKSTENPQKIYITGTIIAAIVILSVVIRDICLLGIPSMGIFYFPSYSAVSIISIGDFLTRFEALVAINYMFTGLVKVSVCLFAAAIGMAKIFNVQNYKTMAYPAGLLMITLATIVYKNTAEMFDWLTTYSYYALPFQVILPLIILAGAEIKNFINKVIKTTV
jgi:spore germination protein KB